MNKLVLVCAFGATLGAPMTASAETQTILTAPATTSFLILDLQSGGTLATLVPVGNDRRVFRLIGNVAAPAPRVEAPSAANGSWLTPGQFQAQEKADDRGRFYTPPDAG